MEAAVVEGVLARCRAAGADVRVSFYNLMFDEEVGPGVTTPIGSVDGRILNKLLAQADRTFPETERQLAQAREAARMAEHAEIERKADSHW